MIARLIDGNIVPCPKQGRDGQGRYHTNLPRYYESHLDEASIAGFYLVIYTEKPDDDYVASWELQLYLNRMCIVQIWTKYTPEPEPPEINIEKLRADVDYIAMMEDIDLEG